MPEVGPQQAFELATPAGTIRGTVFRAAPDRFGSGRRPTVMLCHGFTGNRMESGFFFVQLGRALATAGIHAATFDFLGSGESDGRFHDMRVSGEIRDAVAVARWLECQPFVDRSRLGGLGFSLGGLVVCGAHARLGGFAALALLAPTTSPNLARFAGEAPGGFREPVVVGPHTLPPAFFEDLAAIDTVPEAASPAVPTLWVQGTDDTAVPPDVAKAYARAIEAAGGRVEAVSVAGADHAFTHPQWREPVLAAVPRFFVESLDA